MHPILRGILAVVAGLIVAVTTIFLLEMIGHMVYPPPAELDATDPDQMAAYLQIMPIGAILFVLAAWAVGTFVGGCVACLIARRRPLLFAGIIGGVILLATIATLVYFAHPIWFAMAGVLAIPAAALLASRVAAPRAQRKDPRG